MLWLNKHMDPYQQQSPSSGSPYEFIMNPGQPPKKKRVGFGRSNLPMTIGVIIGGAVLLMIVLSIVLSMFAPKNISKSDLIGLAQSQSELMRISDLAARNGTQQVTKNLAVTVQFTMNTEQKKVIALLDKEGVKLGEKELSLKQNAITDQQLTTAKVTSTYDLVFSQVLQNELESYAKSLKTLHGKAASKTERDLTSTYYEQTQLLISQIPYTQNTIQSAGQ